MVYTDTNLEKFFMKYRLRTTSSLNKGKAAAKNSSIVCIFQQI